MSFSDFQPTHFKIETLTNIIGTNPVVLISLVEELLKGSEKTTLQLQENIELGNWNAVKNNAHFLKSNFRYIGCANLSELLKTIEHHAPIESKRLEIPELMNQFNLSFGLVMADLKAFLTYLKK